jgi:hypothetical protein
MKKALLILCAILLSIPVVLIPTTLLAGSIFLTGHDPDFHATLGGNTVGAININKTAISFVTDPGFNTFKAGGVNKFLFVESSISPPGGHTVGENGIIASGYTAGVDFVHVDASTLNTALNALGTTYNAIVIASDFGGILTQAELDILNARSTDIISFLNAGGGLYAESWLVWVLTIHRDRHPVKSKRVRIYRYPFWGISWFGQFRCQWQRFA